MWLIVGESVKSQLTIIVFPLYGFFVISVPHVIQPAIFFADSNSDAWKNQKWSFVLVTVIGTDQFEDSIDSFFRGLVWRLVVAFHLQHGDWSRRYRAGSLWGSLCPLRRSWRRFRIKDEDMFVFVSDTLSCNGLCLTRRSGSENIEVMVLNGRKCSETMAAVLSVRCNSEVGRN